MFGGGKECTHLYKRKIRTPQKTPNMSETAATDNNTARTMTRTFGPDEEELSGGKIM